MADPREDDPAVLATRLAALSDDQLLVVLSVVTAGRPALEPVYEMLTRLLAERGAVAPGEGVISGTEDLSGYRDLGPDAVSSQLGGGSGVISDASVEAGVGGYTSGGVPTFESVRDKLEQRFGTSQGMGELDQQSPAGRSAEEQFEAREKAARERLEQIRKSMRDDRA